jgi:hypothetical protein
LLRTKLSFVLLFFLILTNPILSRADSSSASAHDQDEKSVAVNQQLNILESPQGHANGVSQEFSDTSQQPNAEKVFFNTNTQPVSRPNIQSNVKTRVHTLDLGAEIFYYRYQEPNPVGVTNQGPMYGFDADYAYRPACPSFLNNFIANVYSLQARYATSRDLEYKGSGIVKGKHDDADEFRGLIGKDYFVGTNIRMTPYLGFGYRYLFDHGNGQLSSSDNYGYDRKSHYYYLPLGGDMAVAMPHHWEIDYNIEYDIFLHGVQKSYLSDGDQFGGNNPNITNNQDKGFGIRGSIRFLKHGPLVDFYVEPYIRFWNIEQSSAVTASVDGHEQTLVEPKNNTTEVGSEFGIQF